MPFAADEDFTGGSTASVTHAIDTSGVTNPAPQAVYQSNRYGNFSYVVPGLTAGASYTVRLHFAEEYWTAAGSRIFNVIINGKQVLTNFDILATAGAEYKAVVEQFTASGASSPATAQSEKAAAAVATNYYRAIVDQNYRLAFTYLAANVTGPDGRRLTLQGFLQLAHMFDGQGGPVTSFSAAAFQSMVVMTINRKKYGLYHAHLQMTRYKDGWTIISIDRI